MEIPSMEDAMTGFTVGFVFSRTGRHVLLLKKQRPVQHRGLYNGVGGRKKPGETWLECMSRECREESGLWIPEFHWYMIERTIADTGEDLFIYAAWYKHSSDDVREGDAGQAIWSELKPTVACVPDVPRLVTLGRKTILKNQNAFRI